jgi:hypothetical protein
MLPLIKSFLDETSYKLNFIFTIVITLIHSIFFLTAWSLFVYHNFNDWSFNELMLFFAEGYIIWGLWYGNTLYYKVATGDFQNYLTVPKSRIYLLLFEDFKIKNILKTLIISPVCFILSGYDLVSILFLIVYAVVVITLYKIAIAGIIMYFNIISDKILGEYDYWLDVSSRWPNKSSKFWLLFTYLIPGFLFTLWPIEFVKNPTIEIGLILISGVLFLYVLAYYFWNKGLEKWQVPN